jgi:hypothetical protein
MINYFIEIEVITRITIQEDRFEILHGRPNFEVEVLQIA